MDMMSVRGYGCGTEDAAGSVSDGGALPHIGLDVDLHKRRRRLWSLKREKKTGDITWASRDNAFLHEDCKNRQ